MTFKKTAVLLLASSLMVSVGRCQSASGEAPVVMKQSAQIDQSRCKEYLDEMWVRITRTWGIADKKSSDFDAVSVSFDLDRKGCVSNIAI